MYSKKVSPNELARMIDHTNLNPYAREKDIHRLCNEAVEYQFGAVCVNSCYVTLCHKLLGDTSVQIAAVVGFPLGSTTTKTKVLETSQVIERGGNEIDMVMNVGYFRDEHYEYVRKEIEQVVKAAEGKEVKVILETGYMTDEQIVKACKICMAAEAHYVKTSTGFGPMGAFIDHVRLMKRTVGDNMGIKAAGGIRDGRTAIRMINAGATRLGASSGINIISSLSDTLADDNWYSEDDDDPEAIFSWGAANPNKQPREIYEYYIAKKEAFNC